MIHEAANFWLGSAVVIAVKILKKFRKIKRFYIIEWFGLEGTLKII